MIFYKALNKNHLNVSAYIPGTVTTNLKEAATWFERYSSKKKNIRGAAKHIQRGEAVIIAIEYEDELMTHEEFQRSNIKEHQRQNCWTSTLKTKAQINTPVSYRIMDLKEIPAECWF